MIIITFKVYQIDLLAKETNKYDQPVKGNKTFNNFPNWPTDLSKKAEYIALFPNVMIGLHIDHFYIFWLEPKSINETKEHLMMYYVGDESANGVEFSGMRKKNAEFWKEVMSEDIKAIEGVCRKVEIHQHIMVEIFLQ